MAYLTTELAQDIVRRTMSIINGNVNIMNSQGQIIGSGQQDRIGEIHEGAVLVLAQKRALEIDSAVASQLQGVRPGVNLPLHAEGKIIGVIGLTGDPKTLRQFGRNDR